MKSNLHRRRLGRRVAAISMAWRAETPCGAFGFGHCEWNGLLSSVTNANGLVAKYAYDVMDRVTNIAGRTTGGAALGAALCMRSKSVNGHANQCCYDKCGKLITHGSGSGSADYAPGEFATFFEHREKDMFPADWAKKLDGGIWGDVAKHICCVALKRELKNVREILEYWMYGYGFCGDGN